MLPNVNRMQFGIGLLIVLVTGTLLVVGTIESGVAIAIGMIGIVAIAFSGRTHDQT
jgi:hypothetical protein